MVLFDLSSMASMETNLESMTKTEIVSFIARFFLIFQSFYYFLRTTRLFFELESLEKHMNNNIHANLEKFNISSYYEKCTDVEECFSSFYNETYANVTSLLIEFLQNFTQVDIVY